MNRVWLSILIAAAVIPAVFLMIKVFRSDRLERESPSLLMRLAVMGVLSSLLALVEEWMLVVDTGPMKALDMGDGPHGHQPHDVPGY